MTRLVTTVLLTLALAAPLGACAKRGSLETPSDSTAHRSYPAPSPGAVRAAEPAPSPAPAQSPAPVPVDPFLGAMSAPGANPAPLSNLPE
jgi:hypothetical protein